MSPGLRRKPEGWRHEPVSGVHWCCPWPPYSHSRGFFKNVPHTLCDGHMPWLPSMGARATAGISVMAKALSWQPRPSLLPERQPRGEKDTAGLLPVLSGSCPRAQVGRCLQGCLLTSSMGTVTGSIFCCPLISRYEDDGKWLTEALATAAGSRGI